ncbi:MAG: 8-amino-7-oxononanoate synthase [Flavobacteriales bacterium CG_4_9_14_3_um_filter_40_17]|nr:MAG: 8-amino-7-oxononanoate synthase [Flavobacteriales bacterium CG_4_9_14_3_um_filter_40_17]
MKKIPKPLIKKLEKRQESGAFRTLKTKSQLIDFSSNDYLGLARLEAIPIRAEQILNESGPRLNGATGSRLLTGHSVLFERVENQIANFHLTETCLIFNSGYDANIGVFSALPQRNDFVLYDEFAHASIRDGLRLTLAKSQSYKHNDFEDLEKKIKRTTASSTVWVATEAVFSMDGDSPDWDKFGKICNRYDIHLIIDEAHATGVLDNLPKIYRQTNLEKHLTARVVTFGKALGCHGAAVLGKPSLKDYLINFARSMIYTTALPPVSLANILAAYECLQDVSNRKKLQENINFFNENLSKSGLDKFFIPSQSAIHCCIIPGNNRIKKLSLLLEKSGFDVRAILSPTVPEGKERLRFCLHAHNTESELQNALEILTTQL